MRHSRFLKFSRYACVGVFALALAACGSIEERIQSHYEKAEELFEQGEYTKAGLEYRSALTLNNDYVPALYRLAEVEFRNGEYQRAAAFYTKVAELDPNHVEARRDLGRFFLLANAPDQALRYIDEGLAIEPNHIGLLTAKAAWAIRTDDLVLAADLADQVLEREATNSDALLVRANERMRNDDPKGAIAYLDRASEDSPGYLSLQTLKLTALERLGETEKIEAVFNRLIELNPEASNIRYTLARWYARKDRPQDAINVIRAYADDFPDKSAAGLNLVRAIRATDGNEAAEAELKRLIENGQTDNFDYRTALSEFAFARNDDEAGIAILKELSDSFSGTENGTRAELQLANRLIRLTRMEDAKVLINQILDRDAENPQALILRAGLFLQEDKTDEALTDLIQANDLSPNSSRVLYLLGSVYERTGKIELAEENFVKAAQIEQFDPAIGLDLTRFLFRYGKETHGENILNQVIERSPANVEALSALARLKIRRQEWAEAERIAKQLDEAGEPGAQAARQIRAATLVGQRRIDESIDALVKLEENTRDGGSAFNGSLFRLYIQSQRFEEAQKLVEADVRNNPKDAVPQIRLALLKSAQDMQDESESILKAALSKEDNAGRAHLALMEFYARANRFDETISLGEQTLERDDINPLAVRFMLAFAYEKRKEPEKAIEEYEVLHKLNPRSVIFANNLASLLADTGTDENIERAYEIVQSRLRNTSVPHFLDTLGWIYYLRGQYGEAVGRLRLAAEGMPDSGLVHYHLGMVYKGLEEQRLAIETLEKAKTLADASDAKLIRDVDDALSTLRSENSTGVAN